MQKNKKPVGCFPTYCTRAAMNLEGLLVSFFLSIYLLGIPLFDIVRSTPSFHCVVFFSSFFIWWPFQIPPSIYVHIIIKCLPQFYSHSFSNTIILTFSTLLLLSLTFRHRASCILGQAFHYSPENAFYIFNQQIYFIIWYLLDRASLI